MSGTKEKTTGKQNAKGRAGKVPAPEMAPADAPDTAGAELPVTLPGHYIPVGSRPASPVTAQADGAFLPFQTTGDVMPETGAAGTAHALVPETDDVVVLEVRAVTERGFWRCGRFWPRQPVQVFASDDPDADNAANNAHLNLDVNCFISHEEAARLKAEPMLVVTVVERVTE